MNYLCNTNNFNKIKAFIVITSFWGLLFSFLIPTWQTPDETTHLNMIGNAFGQEDLSELILADVTLDNGRIASHYDEKINTATWKKSMSKPLDPSILSCKPTKIDPSIIRHLPPSLGIFLGIFLKLPSFWIMACGELFSLAFYISICALALNIMPIKKDFFMLLMLLPMSIQQASSISYDAILLPFCYLFIATIFYLKYEKQRIGLKEFLLLISILLIITYIKIPYILLGGIIFLLPSEKIHITLGKLHVDGTILKKFRIPFFLISILAVIILGYIGQENKLIKIISGCLLEFPRTVYLYLSTFKTFANHLIVSFVGNMGWLDTPVSNWFAYGTILVLFLSVLVGAKNATVTIKSSKKAEHQEPNYRLSKYDITVILLTAFISLIFTMMSMLNHTIMISLFGDEHLNDTYNVRTALYQIPYIGGLQGRYFIPFASLFFLPIPQIKTLYFVKWNPVTISKFVYILFSIVYTIILLYHRYWS